MKVKSAQDSDGANRQAIGEIKVPEGPEEADFAELCQDHLQPVCIYSSGRKFKFLAGNTFLVISFEQCVLIRNFFIFLES